MTGAHDGLPAGSGPESCRPAGTESGFSQGRSYLWLLAGGMLAAVLGGYLIAGGYCFRPALGTVPVALVASPAKVASGDFLAVLLQMPLPGQGTPALAANLPAAAQTVSADPAYPLLDAAVKTDLMDLASAVARPAHARVVLPPIWHEDMRYTWFRQIGELGRITYQPMADPDGLPFAANGGDAEPTLASIFD